MLYSYGSFLSKITLSLLCIVAPVPYVSINPSKKREVQVVYDKLENMINSSIKKQSLELSHVRFHLKMKYLSIRSIDVFKKKYSKSKNIIESSEAFILDSLLELFMRSREGILLNYSDFELNKIFNESIGVLYNSQNKVLKNGQLLDKFGILFSLWQFEEQEDEFIKFYRYSYFFNFKNERINMPTMFFKSFGTRYEDFVSLAVDIMLITLAGDYENYYNYISQIANKYRVAFETLSITSDEYYQKSLIVSNDLDDIAFSVKVSQSFPFIKHNNAIYLPLPHACITACTKSLLYRLTYNDDESRRKIGKEVMESYVYHILSTSESYDIVSKEVFFNHKKNILSPDVLCFENGCLFAFECKLLTPSSKTRILDDDAVLRTKEILIDDICKLYKSLFVNYSTKENGLPFIEKDNRFGAVVSLERIDFDHKTIMEAVANKLKLEDEERKFLEEHIRFDALYAIERLTFLRGNAIKEIKEMIRNEKIYDFDISHKTCNKNYSHKEFLSYKKKILDIKDK